MKFCKDCRWLREGRDCIHPNLADVVTGQMTPREARNIRGQTDLFATIRMNRCGFDAHWFEPKERLEPTGRIDFWKPSIPAGQSDVLAEITEIVRLMFPHPMASSGSAIWIETKNIDALRRACGLDEPPQPNPQPAGVPPGAEIPGA